MRHRKTAREIHTTAALQNRAAYAMIFTMVCSYSKEQKEAAGDVDSKKKNFSKLPELRKKF